MRATVLQQAVITIYWMTDFTWKDYTNLVLINGEHTKNSVAGENYCISAPSIVKNEYLLMLDCKHKIFHLNLANPQQHSTHPHACIHTYMHIYMYILYAYTHTPLWQQTFNTA